MVIKREVLHEQIYFYSLMLLLIGLPLSKFLMSVSQIILLLNWIIEGRLAEKFRSFFKNRLALILSSVFFLHLLGLLYTSNFNYALNDIRIKMPLLVFPLLLSTSTILSSKQISVLLKVFVASVLLASFISMLVVLGIYKVKVEDFRRMSIFISHIRFALLICIAIFSNIYLFRNATSKNKKYILAIVTVWLTIFLFILQSFTGIIIVACAFVLYVLNVVWNEKRCIRRWIYLSVLFFVPFIGSFYVYSIYLKLEPKKDQQMGEISSNNNVYTHFSEQKITENGYYIGWNICWLEVEKAWNKRSEIDYVLHDKKVQFIETTLFRYLTSKVLKKDSASIASLSEDDIRKIERGVTNYKYADFNGLEAHIYQTLWEFKSYQAGENPSGHSITMRLEFLKAAKVVLKENWMLGVGTGDVNDVTLQKYEEIKTPLEKKYRLRAHNQYLTFAITFGILGMIWFLFSMFYPLRFTKNEYYSLFVLFLITASFSMLNEDTLETQAGVTFFAFFNSFFLFMGLNKKS